MALELLVLENGKWLMPSGDTGLQEPRVERKPWRLVWRWFWGTGWTDRWHALQVLANEERGFKGEARVETQIWESPIRGNHLNSSHYEIRKGPRRRTGVTEQKASGNTMPCLARWRKLPSYTTHRYGHLSLYMCTSSSAPAPQHNKTELHSSQLSTGYTFQN